MTEVLDAAAPGDTAATAPPPAGSARRRRGRFARSAASGSSELVEWVERRTGLTSNGLLVVGFAVLGFVLARIVATQALLLLVYGVLILLACCFAIGRRRLDVRGVRGDLPGRVRAGRRVQVDLELTANRRVSTVVLEEHLHARLGRDVRLPVALIPAGDGITHSYTFTPALRGVYEVGPLVVTWTDPIGLTRHRMTVAEPTKLIVHPVVEPAHDRVMTREWEDPPVRPPVSKPWPTGFEFYGMRDYVSGDDPRRIVWRKTAQNLDTATGVGRYLVRESEQGITERVHVVLDTDQETHSPGDVSETFELAVRAAASLGVKHLDDSFTVLLDANTGPLTTDLRGKRGHIPLLDALAGATRGKEGLGAALDRILTSTRRNAHYVVLTPYVSPDAAVRLRVLLSRGVSVLLVLVMWDDTDLTTLHRVGALGCNVIELSSRFPLDRAFQRGVKAAIRR